MQQLTTVYQNPKWLIRQPSTSENVGDCSANPLRIDAPCILVSTMRCRVMHQYGTDVGISLGEREIFKAKKNSASYGNAEWNMEILEYIELGTGPFLKIKSNPIQLFAHPIQYNPWQ